MNQLISVGIGQYWFGSVIFGLNISLDGLNVKVSINISKDWLISVKHRLNISKLDCLNIP